MKVKLAEALLRRKELNEKVNQLREINVRELFEIKATRKKVTDDVDDIVAQVPKLQANQVTAEFDFYAQQLRRIDGVIQQTNWITEVEVDDFAMKNYAETKE